MKTKVLFIAEDETEFLDQGACQNYEILKMAMAVEGCYVFLTKDQAISLAKAISTVISNLATKGQEDETIRARQEILSTPPQS